MNNHFDIHIDRYWNTATIMLNHVLVPQYSPLARCATAPVEAWIQDLPTMLFREVNSDYTLRVSCHPYLCYFLKSLFKNEPMCKDVQTYSEQQSFSTASRLSWAKEAASELKYSMPRRTPIVVTAEYALQANIHSNSQLASIDASLFSFTSGKSGNVHLIQSVKELCNFSQAARREIAYCITDDEIYVNMQQCMPVVFGRIEDFPIFLTDYYDYSFDRPYLLSTHSELLARCNNRPIPFSTRAKVEMIMKDTPSVLLTVPRRVELGNIVNYKLESFPDTNLRIESLTPGIVSSKGGQIFASTVGKTMLQVYGGKHELVAEGEIEVFAVNRVNSIRLSTTTNETIYLQGSTISITASFTPANAENLHLAKWSVSNPKILTQVGHGVFEAVGFGSCRITLSVEKISAYIDISILQQATDIHLPSAINLKVNAVPFRLNGQLIPAGAACKDIACRVIDTSIASWDSSSNRITPISEGTTKLEVTLTNAQNSIVQRKYCDVNILPSQTIVTPEPSMAFLCLCCFFALLTSANTMLPFALSLLMGCACWHLFHIFKGSSLGNVWKLKKLDFLIALISIVISITSLLLYYL